MAKVMEVEVIDSNPSAQSQKTPDKPRCAITCVRVSYPPFNQAILSLPCAYLEEYSDSMKRLLPILLLVFSVGAGGLLHAPVSAMSFHERECKEVFDYGWRFNSLTYDACDFGNES